MVLFVWWMHWTLLLFSICGGGVRFPGGSDVKEFAYSSGDLGSIPWSGRFPWRITPFLPGESHGQRKLVGYRPWGFKKSNTTEHFHTFFFFLSVSKEARTLKMSTGQVKYWHSPPSTILNIRLLFYLNEVDLVWTDGQLEGNHRDFPGGLVAKTPHSQYRGLGFDPWSGN